MDVLQRYLAEEIMRRVFSIKCLVITINALFLAWYFALVIIGVSVQQTVIDSYNLFADYILWSSPVTVLFGVLHFCVALFGINSIYNRKLNLIHKYIIMLSLALVVETAFLTTGFVVGPRTFKSVLTTLRSSEYLYGKDHTTFSTWNSVQQNFKCCGVDYYIEWLNYTDSLSLPDSCCIFYSADCGKVALKTLVFYKNGCGTELYGWTLSRGIPIAITVIISILLKVTALIFSWQYLRLLREYTASLYTGHRH